MNSKLGTLTSTELKMFCLVKVVLGVYLRSNLLISIRVGLDGVESGGAGVSLIVELDEINLILDTSYFASL